MKRLKHAALLLVVIVLLMIAVPAWVIFYGKPKKVDTMATRQFAQFLLASPETLSNLGFIDGTFLDFHSGRLNDRSPEGRERRQEMIADFRSQLDRYDTTELPPDQKLSHDVWRWWLDTEIALAAWPVGEPLEDPYVVSQYGVQSELPSLLSNVHDPDSEKMADRYLQRISRMPEAIDQTIATFRLDADAGFLPPRSILLRTEADIDALIEPRPAANPIVVDYVRRLRSNGFEAQRIVELERQASGLLAEKVYPAFERLKTAISEKRSQARVDEPGLIGMKDGLDLYRAYIRRYTSRDLDPIELHATGLAEVERISNEIYRIGEELGFGDLSEPENLAALEDAASYDLDDTEAGREKLIEITESIIAEARERSEPYFNRFPRAEVEVRPIPEHQMASASNSYSAPASDGSRPGYYNLNVRNPSAADSIGLPSLTYHEAIPGHHYQIALAREIGLPILRRNLPFPAYTEGWALYVETIADEMGLYDDNPAGRIGALRSELFRATRLVVDTGLHAKGWTREEARNYMSQALSLVPSESESDEPASKDSGDETMDVSRRYAEIDRYLARPGQALAYKVGQLEIQRLRDLAEERLGSSFDLAEFHDQILMEGALPLDILAEGIENWIEETAGR